MIIVSIILVTLYILYVFTLVLYKYLLIFLIKNFHYQKQNIKNQITRQVARIIRNFQ